jgi:hypothetical protein
MYTSALPPFPLISLYIYIYLSPMYRSVNSIYLICINVFSVTTFELKQESLRSANRLFHIHMTLTARKTKKLRERVTRTDKWSHNKQTPWPESASELYRPSDRPLVAELSAKFCGYRLPRGQLDGSLRTYSRLSRPETLLFLPSSSSIVLTKLSAPRSRPTAFQKIW